MTGEFAICIQVSPDDLNINGSGKPEVQNLRDDVCRQEIKRNAGEFLRELQAQIVHILSGGAVLLRQLNQNIGVSRPYGRRGAVGKIEAAVRQSDIVNHTDNFGRRNLLADHGVHPVAERGRFFDARACGRAHVKLEFATVHGREKVLPHEREQGKREYAGGQKADRKRGPVADAALKQAMVAAAEALECVLEFLLFAYETISGLRSTP